MTKQCNFLAFIAYTVKKTHPDPLTSFRQTPSRQPHLCFSQRVMDPCYSACLWESLTGFRWEVGLESESPVVAETPPALPSPCAVSQAVPGKATASESGPIFLGSHQHVLSSRLFLPHGTSRLASRQPKRPACLKAAPPYFVWKRGTLFLYGHFLLFLAAGVASRGWLRDEIRHVHLNASKQLLFVMCVVKTTRIKALSS